MTDKLTPQEMDVLLKNIAIQIDGITPVYRRKLYNPHSDEEYALLQIYMLLKKGGYI